MLKVAVPLLATFALIGCSAGTSDSDRSAIIGGEVFLELIDDARVAMQAGDLSKAASFYDEAIALEPENPALWVDIARLRFRGGEHLIAIEAADYALELDAGYAPALLMKAQLVRDAHGFSESLPWFEAAVQADPRNPEVLSDYAATLGELGRYQDMLAVVRETSKFAPDYPQLRFLQAVMAARAENPVLAGSLLYRSGLVGLEVPSALMLDAIVDIQQGNFDTAAETLGRLSDRQPGNQRVNEMLARALWLGGRDRALVDRFSPLADEETASPYLVMLVGRSLERMGDRRRAVPYLQRAMATRDVGLVTLPSGTQGNGSIPAATIQLRNMVEQGGNRRAQSRSRALIAQTPQSADVHALAADAALNSGDAHRALELYEISARVRRSWPLTRKVIFAFDQTDDQVSSDVLLTRYVAGDPQNTEALFLLASRSAAREDWLRVAVLLDTAIGLGSGNDIGVLQLRSDAARALGDEDEAERIDRLLRELNPGDFL